MGQDLTTAPLEILLRALIKQLCVNRPKLPQAVKHLSSNAALRKSNKIDVKTLKSTLVELAKELGGVYIIIDALDELRTPVLNDDEDYLKKLGEARSNMIGLLQNLSECDDTHLLVTSKDNASYDIIDRNLTYLAQKEGNNNILIEGEGLETDIGRMIDEELNKPHWQAYNDPDLLALIKKKTGNPEVLNGM